MNATIEFPTTFFEAQEDDSIELLHRWMRDSAPPEIAALWHAREVLRIAQHDPNFSDERGYLEAIRDIAVGRQFVDGCEPARRVAV